MSARGRDRPRRDEAPPPTGGLAAGRVGSPRPAAEDDLLAGLPALLRDLAAAGVVELEVSAGDARLYVRQRLGAAPITPSTPVASGARPVAAATVPEPAEEAGLVAVVAPLAGVFYGAPSPDEPPFVAEGDEVEAGQVVGLIEAMKVFNEIHVDVAGIVAKVLATGGESVQAGQRLIQIRPHGGATAGPEGATTHV